jgi:hypothetical protein
VRIVDLLYNRLAATEGASWFCTLAWGVMTVILLVRFRSARAAARRQSTADDDMSKELTQPQDDASKA